MSEDQYLTKKQTILLNHGYNLFINDKLYEERYIGNVKDSFWFYHLEILVRIKESSEIIKDYIEYNIQNIIDELGLPLDIHNYCILNLFDIVTRYSTIQKKNVNKNYNLDWHFDNRTLVTHHIDKIKTIKNVEVIHYDKNKAYCLWDCKRRPKYTMIMYFNSYGIDFLGGRFMFNDAIIEPQYGDILFFNSDEIHKVENVIKGTRNALVVKFYDIDKLINDK